MSIKQDTDIKKERGKRNEEGYFGYENFGNHGFGQYLLGG
jgi:hypothetical protein